MTDDTQSTLTKTRLAARWLIAAFALLVLSCGATIFSQVVQGAFLLASAVCLAFGLRHVWDNLNDASGKS